jgi:hypothetical protein
MRLGRVPLLALLGVLTSVVIACSSDIEEVRSTSASIPDIPEFDTRSFASINPHPEIPRIDTSKDPAFGEHERIPRDAINPVYTPKFVSPEELRLRPDEIVLGLEINGDTRAYPVGIMRIREMVNDEVGGTPVLVTW